MKKYMRFGAALIAMAFTILIFANTASAGDKKGNQYWPAGPDIVSLSGIVMEANTGTILYEKNIHDAHYPASITKILTALLAVENSKMDEIVTFSHDSVYNTEGSGIARDVGEEMTMEQCLYGMMLASANECAYAIGEHVAGDMASFVQMMNDRATEIGCLNTHFNNCNGLPDEQHYTSAYDMALIAREAFQNETFRIICGTKTYTIPFTNKHTDEETYLQNHHQMLYPFRTRQYLYDYCLGGKTGYTSVANYTLTTYAEKDGMTLICVVLNGELPHSHYEDTRALFDFCFDNFKIMNVSEHEALYSQSDQEHSGILEKYEPFVSVQNSCNIILPITAEFSDADSEITYDDQSKDVLGSIQYTYADRPVGGADITATGARVEMFQFQEETEQTEVLNEAVDVKPDKKEFKIDFKLVCLVLCVLFFTALFIFALWRLISSNTIRRKLHFRKREKSPYKTIKQNKMFRKRRKWF